MDGSDGTLPLRGFVLKREKPVVSLGSWRVDPAVHEAAMPADAGVVVGGVGRAVTRSHHGVACSFRWIAAKVESRDVMEQPNPSMTRSEVLT
ncbi:MAG: hypothetical protein AAF628_22040 [Planctomycetota bacterium]